MMSNLASRKNQILSELLQFDDLWMKHYGHTLVADETLTEFGQIMEVELPKLLLRAKMVFLRDFDKQNDW